MNKKERNMKIYNSKKKSALMSVGLSLIFTGLGHFYIKQYGKGIILLLFQIALWFIMMGWIMWIITPILAYADTKKYNELLRLELNID